MSIKLILDMRSFSSGVNRITIEGDPLGAVCAARAIMTREGITGRPHPEEIRCGVTLSDSGTRHGSIYAVASPLKPVKGRHVNLDEATELGRYILTELGAVVVGGEEPEPEEEPSDG